MDLCTLCTKDTSEEGAWLEVLALDWETKTEASILVLGPDSNVAVSMADEEEKTALKLMAATYGKKGKVEDITESSEEREIRKAIKLTKDWKGFEKEGKPFEYNKANAEWLYRNSPHTRTQVIRFYQSRLNFTNPGSKTSAKRSGKDSR